MSDYRDLLIDIEDYIINNPRMPLATIAEVFNVHPDFVLGIYNEMDPVSLQDALDAEDRYDDSMDGDEASALASVGWGTDEDYGYSGDED